MLALAMTGSAAGDQLWRGSAEECRLRLVNEVGAVRVVGSAADSAPMLDGAGEVIGIVELSRTGSSPADAGADFTSVDGANLEKCCKVFAPFVARTWTDRDGRSSGRE